ncbi:MAG: dihydrouridine synthase [Candidatus Harrisonbacteria bacterium CG10_big_fil_rev_8_21_14_0_10_44_23]|uniref:tRNA-dihydrouridine synthase n=1 Tax=Candidatus Harrisonbacteria bacterium CG10_big_fil_rev_8_21_14_0_10_44_23 TaxID=1974585 RepID=A0A2H0UPX7_9BACT|nr:MAG: dihydrouridine synthase [Candidatus Harrisonbacteria bacterium CG10_big_fil_rev_8_21_14_0_10_44_23]
MKGFWDKLAKPISALAPMANVTDAAFRRMLLKYGRPDVFWTEFVSVEALLSKKGRRAALQDLKFSKKEKPIVAQIFGSKPEQFTQAAKIIKKLGFSGIDINMGCPDRSIEKSGAGAALIKNSDLAKQIILATKKGAGNLPVSVKTRTGYNSDVLEEWVANLAEGRPAAIILHLRTRKEMSKVPARWDDILRAKKVLEEIPENERPLLLGNGDINSIEEGIEKCKQYGIDGFMVGRGLFDNFKLFSGKEPTQSERIKILLEHAKIFNKTFGKNKNFDHMKKFVKAYIHGFDGAKEMRARLMGAKGYKEFKKLLK